MNCKIKELKLASEAVSLIRIYLRFVYTLPIFGYLYLPILPFYCPTNIYLYIHIPSASLSSHPPKTIPPRDRTATFKEFIAR